jgi:phosphosulfolactate synthase
MTAAPPVLAFDTIPIPQRQTKPRSRGVNMMIDWGMGVTRQLDTLESAGAYIDIAKIAATIPRITPRDLLAFPPREKARAIRQCVDAGLKAYGEVGKKEGALDDAQFLADIDNCLQAGASAVFLEAYELFGHGEVRSALIAEITKRFPAERILYELPVVILPGVHREFKHRITTWLVRELGTEVNLANIEWDEIYITEMVRRGMAGDTSHTQGAYRLAGFEPSE